MGYWTRNWSVDLPRQHTKIAALAMFLGLGLSVTASAECPPTCSSVTVTETSVEPLLDCVELTLQHSSPTSCDCGIAVFIENNCTSPLEVTDLRCDPDCHSLTPGGSRSYTLQSNVRAGTHSWTFMVRETDTGTDHEVVLSADVELTAERGCSVVAPGRGTSWPGFVAAGALLVTLWRRSAGAREVSKRNV